MLLNLTQVEAISVLKKGIEDNFPPVKQLAKEVIDNWPASDLVRTHTQGAKDCGPHDYACKCGRSHLCGSQFLAHAVEHKCPKANHINHLKKVKIVQICKTPCSSVFITYFWPIFIGISLSFMIYLHTESNALQLICLYSYIYK